jgi:uncharacterized protein
VFTVSASQIVLMLALILVAGLATGVLAGLFGIGGGTMIIPALYEVFGALGVSDDVRMQLCIGTSLAIIVPTNLHSYRAHAARGAALPGVVRMWAAPAIVGVAVGALLAASAPGWVFKVAFIVLALLVALKTLFGRDDWRLGDRLPGRIGMTAYGFIVGLSASLMGISGGAISNLVLMLYGTPIHRSVATSAGVGVPITIAGTIGYMLAGWPHQAQMPPFSLGFVSLLAVLLMAPVSSFMASYGVRLAHWLPKRALENVLGIYLLLIAARFTMSLF